ncbi:MAG: hypothetical protein KC620_12670, partial [Myxococcales bacterium]|nr:hypothetical protein [Myxococcales bacterium]
MSAAAEFDAGRTPQTSVAEPSAPVVEGPPTRASVELQRAGREGARQQAAEVRGAVEGVAPGPKPAEAPRGEQAGAPPQTDGAVRGGAGAPEATGMGAGATPVTADAVAAPGASTASAAGDYTPIQMPPPDSTLSAEEAARLDTATDAMAATGDAATALPTGQASADAAREAVTEPTEETTARAEGGLAEALDERPAPSAEVLALCDRIRQAIRDRRPPDEDSLVDADPEAMAQAAGAELEADVQGDADRVQGEYDALDEQPSGVAAQTPTPIETPDAAVAADGVDATVAVPDPVPEEEVSLDADVEAQGRAIEEAGMNTEPAELVEDGPIGEARGAQEELSTAAVETPGAVASRQQQALATARTDMANLQAQALAALTESRAATVASTTGRQGQMVGSEEQMRTQAGQRMRQIFADAR